jgi:hypothetical protein
MTDFKDPPRLADSATGDARLGALFRSAREDVPTDQELAQLAARLGPVLGPAPAAPAAGKLGLLAKVGSGVLLVGLGVWGVLHQRAHEPVAAVSAAKPPVIAAPPPVAAAPEVSAPSVETTPALPAAELSPAPSSAPSAHTPASARTASPARDEATILERARTQLAANPAQALALTAEHVKLFPHGVLSQEREVIAIAALRRLGRTAEAERRAEAFDRSYPHSAHQHTVDAEPAK